MSDWDERVILEQGDLTEARVDAIVNAANDDLQLGGGVAGAIRRKGDPSIQRECDAHGSVPIGEAAITGGGELNAKYVIHAASMRLGGATSAGSLRASTRNSLLRAKEKGLESVAFPAVGTGSAGFSMRECAEIMLEETMAHLQGATSLRQVRFVLYDAAALAVFGEVWKEAREAREAG